MLRMAAVSWDLRVFFYYIALDELLETCYLSAVSSFTQTIRELLCPCTNFEAFSTFAFLGELHRI